MAGDGEDLDDEDGDDIDDEDGDDIDDEEMPMFNAEMMVESARFSGYKDAAMALGELIDNSLQAGATKIDVLVAEKLNRVRSRRVWQVHEIAVLDNGCGMGPKLLQRALRFGDGEHHKESDGMGKFGLGLPQASISQAKRIDVWSWTDGIGSAKHAFIDIADKKWKKRGNILPSDDQKMPKRWIQESGRIKGKTGTLVVWSILDRLTWTKASTIYTNSDFLVGRMYRHWLTTDNKHGRSKAKIRLVSFDQDGKEEREKWWYKPNDPMYRLSRSSGMLSTTKRKVRFDTWGESITKTYQFENEDEKEVEEKVTIRFTMASRDLREPFEGTDAGRLDYGKHAKKNIGVSIVRADRELELDSRFGVSKDPRNRWWGAEISFGPGMDVVFGVSNSKQHAENLSGVANKDWDDFSEGSETWLQTKERLEEEDYPLFCCLDVATTVTNNISKIMTTIGKMRTSSKSGPKRHADSPERKGTEATKKRKVETGKEGDSDPEEELTKEQRMKKLRKFLEEIDLDKDSIEETIGDILDTGLKYSFAHTHMNDDAFFSVDGIAGAIVITLNSGHAAYNELFETLGADTKDKTPQELNQLLLKANAAVLLMLIAWSRLEDEAQGNSKLRYKDTRNDWGRITRDFLLFGKE